MNRESIVEFYKEGLYLYQYNIFRYTQSKFDKLTKSVFKSRGDAYKAIDDFINFWHKDTQENDRFFRYKYSIDSSNFIIKDVPKDWDPSWNWC